jgi:hypothetical protein
MPLQLRAIYRNQSRQTTWALVLERTIQGDWKIQPEIYEDEKWIQSTTDPTGAMRFCGLQLEQKDARTGRVKVIHSVTGIQVIVAGELVVPGRPLVWDKPIPANHPTWPYGIDPNIKLGQSRNEFFSLDVWVRVPSLLMSFGSNVPGFGGDADYLWVKYQMSVPGRGLDGPGVKIEFAPVAGDGRPWGAVKTSQTPLRFVSRELLDYEMVTTYEDGESPILPDWLSSRSSALGFVERTLGVRAYADGKPTDLFLSWEGIPAALVMRRRFSCVTFGTDPFLRAPKPSDPASVPSITLEQRAVQTPVESAATPPSFPEAETALYWMSDAWGVQAMKLNYRPNARGTLETYPNPAWEILFANGWKSLMATWEPNIADKPLLLFHLHPTGNDTSQPSYSPFPLLRAATRIKQSYSNGKTPHLDHLLVTAPPLAPLKDGTVPGKWKLSFPALRNHQDEIFTCHVTELVSKRETREHNLKAYAYNAAQVDAKVNPPYLLELRMRLGLPDKSYQSPFRAGSLDLGFDSTANVALGLDLPCCFFVLRPRQSQEPQWNQNTPLDLAFWGIGYSLFNSQGTAARQPEEQPLHLPLSHVTPGETDHHIAETESWSQEGGSSVAKDRPLLLPLGRVDSAATGTGGLLLAIKQIHGLNFSEKTHLSVRRAGSAGINTRRFAGRVFYVDRTPFFVGILDTNPYEKRATTGDDTVGDELLYWTTEGAFRGWQRRAERGDFRAVLQAQGVGEASEKGLSKDGYQDLEEGELVSFRFTAVTLLTIDASDLERSNHGLPWNIRTSLNALKENRLAGLPLKAASFEMLYGLRFTIKNIPYLRVAELLSRYGHPRRLLAKLPPEGSAYLVDEDRGNADFENLKTGWENMLRLLEERLAVYEVFDDRQVEFDENGLPKGLTLQGERGADTVTAELRKSADLRTSLPSVKGDKSAPPRQKGEIVLLSLPELTPKPGASPSQKPVIDWLSIIPNYERGLAGSFAWAFESKLLYEMLWQDPLLETPAVVESVEATVARLYFSALGGWGVQQASFARGRVIIAVAVDMGRVSELRVEIIGRIGIAKNKAKLVTVFRRSVLPTRQFFDQQDPHYGRPILRKAEEYVEFIEQERSLQDKETVAVDPTLPGCARACSCAEKVLVDSRWGTDFYDNSNVGLGWKVPLRKPGANPHIYGPANVLLHFHTSIKGAKETAGAIENLDDVWFWTTVDPELTDDTNAWPNMPGIDTFPPPAEDPEAPIDLCAQAVPPEAAAYTFRVSGLDHEADLSHHLPPDPNSAPQEQRSVGATLRYVTICRADTARVVADSRTSDKVPAIVSQIRAHGENALALMEQLTSSRAGEVITGWEDKAIAALMPEEPEALRKSLTDALRPAVNAADRLRARVTTFERDFNRGVAPLSSQADAWWQKYKTSVAAAEKKWQDAQTAANALRAAAVELFNSVETGTQELENELKRQVNPAVSALRKLALAANSETAGSLMALSLATLDNLFITPKLGTEEIKNSVKNSLKEVLAANYEDVIHLEKTAQDIAVRLEYAVRGGLAAAAAMEVAAAKPALQREAIKRTATLIAGNKDAAENKDTLEKGWLEVFERPRLGDGKKLVRAELQILFREVLEKTTNGVTMSYALAPKDLGAKLQEAAGFVAQRATTSKALNKVLALKGPDLARHILLVEKIANQPAPRTEAQLQAEVAAGLKEACKAYAQELRKTLQSSVDTVSAEVLSHVNELSRAWEVVTGPMKDADKNAIVAAIQKYLEPENVNTWLVNRRTEVEKGWHELQGKLKAKFQAPVKALRESLDFGTDAELGKKSFERFRSNLQHSLLQSSHTLQTVANDALRDIAAPLEQIPFLLGQAATEINKPEITRKLEGFRLDLEHRAKRLLTPETGTWAKSLQTAAGTTQRVVADLKTAAKEVTNLLTLASAPSWPLPAELSGKVSETQRREILRSLAEVRLLSTRLENLVNVPWFRSLPGRVTVGPALAELRRFEVALEIGLPDGAEDTLKAFAAFKAKFESELNKAKLCLGTALSALHPLPDKPEPGDLAGVFNKINAGLIKPEHGILAKLTSYIEAPNDALKGEILALASSTVNGVHELGTEIERAVEKEIGKISTHFGGQDDFARLSGFVATTTAAVKEMLAGVDDHLGAMPNLETLERGLPQARAWFDNQRAALGVTLSQLGSLKDQAITDMKGDPGKAAVRLFRSFGQVPQVPGLDFTGMAKFDVKEEYRGHVANLESRVRGVGYQFRREVGNYVKMSPVIGMVDRTRNALGAVEESVRLKAASMEMAMRDIRRQLETDVDKLKDDAKKRAGVALKDLIPDLGGLKLEKLLGAAGLSEKFLEQLKAKSKTSHGRDERTLTVWVDSKVENLILDDALTLFSFGPVTMALRQVRLDSHIRIQTNIKGETEKIADGQLLANWEVSMGGQPMITYEQAKLVCKNGKVRMELDPTKIRMPSMLQMLADMMSTISYKDDAGLQAGIRANLPSMVTGFVTFNMDFPPMGGGTTSIQNLRLMLLFELSLAFPRFPSLDDAHLRISAGAGLSDREAPFIIGIFILGGCGWFKLRVDYIVPFKDGKPHLEAQITIAVGASASLCLNLGFASGQVFIALAVEIECTVSSRSHYMYFSFALTISGVLDILGGLITVYLVISLAITYASGQPMRGLGRITITIRICWCFKIKLDKSFTYTFGGGVSRKTAMSPNRDQRTKHLAESSGRIPVPFFTGRDAYQAAAATTAPAEDYHRKAGRMSV